MIKQVWVTQSVTDYRDTDVEGVGSLRFEDNCIYMWVKNAHTAALASGDLACLDPTKDITEVKLPSTAAIMFLAGVVKSTTIPTLKFGWIQVLGLHAGVHLLPHTQATGNWALGDYAKILDTKTYATIDAATQPLYRRTLQLLDATVTTHTTPTANVRAMRCFISCI